MTRWGRIAGAILLLSVAWALPVRGAGLREVGDGYLIDAADAAAVLAAVSGRGPAEPGGVWIAVGQARLWGMPELPLAEVAGGFSLRRPGGAIGGGGAWHRTGDGDLLRIDRWRGWLGWQGGWELRLLAAQESLRVDGEPAAAGREAWLILGRSLGLGEGARLRLRLWADLLPEPDRAQALRPVAEAALLWRTAACAAAWDRRADGTPALAVECCFGLAANAAMALRWDGASGSLGPGLELRLGPVLLRTRHTVHPALGVTHRFSLVAGALGAARR